MDLFCRGRGVAATLAFLLWIGPSVVEAQQGAGEFHLQVKDPSSAGMEAAGKLESLAGGKDRSFQTDTQGSFTFQNVLPGRYRLRLASKGFAAQVLSIDVPSGAPISRTVTMALGASADKIDVVAVTPLAGVDVPPMEIPAPVQIASARDIADSGAWNLADFLNRRIDSVNINEVQGNPFQPDVNYRGYTASPLLGTPQGLSVFMDGVRMNQPFGDVVSWDLIPRVAISEVSLIPGSNPIFGLNTLGGALSIITKDGQRDPGTEIELSGGSFGRKAAELQHGGSNSKGLNWLVAANLFFEDGWRQASPSDVRQFFGKLGGQLARTTLGFTIGYANNSLTGNGLQEQRFLARDYASVYTVPDQTANRAPSFTFYGRHGFGSKVSLSGNLYYRYIRTATLNGDINEDSLDQSVYQPSAADIRALTSAGYTGFPASGANAANTPFPFYRCIAQALQRDEPGEKCNGLLNRTKSEQHNYGLSGQATFFGSLRGNRNQFTAGAGYDGSVVNFVQSSQLGYLNPDRTVTGVNAYGDGRTGGNIDGVPFDTRVDLHGVINTGSVYATDTLSTRRFTLTLSGRYNRTGIDNHDRVQPFAGSGSLTASNAFGRFNPAIGITYNVSAPLNVYFSYGEGSRAPTSIELGCADANQPCKLPNALAGDPPLHQVVTRTFEAGIRGRQESPLDWKAGWFRAANYNDILFVASTQTGFGYFKNFGQTRREGLEASVKGRVRKFSLGGTYTFLSATYQSTERVDGSSNSTNDDALARRPGMDGTIQVTPGDRIPLIPRHLLKAFAAVQATRALFLDLNFSAVSRSYARGNENNLSQPDGVYYLGPGTSPGYGILNAGGRYRIHKRLEVFAQIDNVLNHKYYTGAQLGPTGFNGQGTFVARPLAAIAGEYPVIHATFYAPGAPIGAWGGIRVHF